MYGLTKLVLGVSPFVEVDDTTYRSALHAKKCLREALEIEEKFDLLLSNYGEFEGELLQIGLRAAMYFENEWSASIGSLQTMNRRIVNLLTTCRLYLDQAEHNLSSMYGRDSNVARTMKTARSAEYDARLGYRVMESLRNYVQHRGLPIHSMSLDGRWIDEARNVRKHMRQTVNLRLAVTNLAEDRKVRRAIIAELTALGETSDLKMLIRDYVAGLGSVHEILRVQIAGDLMTWDATIQDLVERYLAVAGDTVGLALVRREGDISVEQTPILAEPISRRRQLADKNFQTKHYDKIVTTNY